jgi:hypothetical protein
MWPPRNLLCADIVCHCINFPPRKYPAECSTNITMHALITKREPSRAPGSSVSGKCRDEDFVKMDQRTRTSHERMHKQTRRCKKDDHASREQADFANPGMQPSAANRPHSEPKHAYDGKTQGAEDHGASRSARKFVGRFHWI